jgi:DNA-binding FadR family transcriptional regulator
MCQFMAMVISPADFATGSRKQKVMFSPRDKEFRPFAPAEPERAFELIVRQMRDRLKSGELRPGDRLPGERELVEHFQVSRNTLREAVRMMEVTGLVHVRRGAGGGMFIADGDPSYISRSMLDMMRLTSFSLSDLLEVRLIVGHAVARVAADRATDEDLALLEANIAEASRLGRIGDWEERSAVNHEFLDLLAAASHNPLLVMVQRSITEVIREVVVAAGPIREDWLIASRQKVLEFIRQHDADGAARQMEQHLERVSDFWMQAMEDNRETNVDTESETSAPRVPRTQGASKRTQREA